MIFEFLFSAAILVVAWAVSKIVAMRNTIAGLDAERKAWRLEAQALRWLLSV